MPILLSTMRRLLSRALLLLALPAMMACEEDRERSLPSFRTDLLSVETGPDSLVKTILLDDGNRLMVSQQRISTVSANASIRCIAQFSVNEDSISALVYDLKKVSCYAPLPADSFKIHPHDPLNVVSVWKSGGYVNMCLAPLIISADAYKYDFCIDSIAQGGEGRTVLHVSLLFLRDKYSAEAYTNKFYHSIPLDQRYYPEYFDSLCLSINTYEGTKHYRFSSK